MDPIITLEDLPIKLTAKYLGYEPARGLWGMQYTRKPVDSMVQKAKDLPANLYLPIVEIEVSKNGLSFKELGKNNDRITFGVDKISYGVQDVIYTRVFSMIVVTDKNLDEGFTFICHGFVCESKFDARSITFGLAAAFKEYAQTVKNKPTRKFAIDLRSPEEQTSEDGDETEA